MNIGVIRPSLPFQSGGNLYDDHLIDFLQQRKNTITVLTPHTNSSILSKKLLDPAVDLVLEDELCYAMLPEVNETLRENRIKTYAIVHTLQGLLEPESSRQADVLEQEKRYLESVDGCLWVSHAVRQATRALVGNIKAGAVVYPGRSAIPSSANHDNDSSVFRLLFVGHLLPHKGLDTLLSALSNLDRGAWRLTVVGAVHASPAYTRQIQIFVERHRLLENVTITGPLPQNQLTEVYCSHDLLVVPSWFEGYGLVYVEAMGCRLPVIATANGGPTEYLTHGKDGFLVQPKNPGELQQLITGILAQPHLLKSMAVEALQTFQRLPTWQETFDVAWQYLSQESSGPPS